MRCPEARDLLSEYLEGTLPERAASLVRSHLLGCAGCRSECEDLRDTLTIVHSLPRQEPVFELWEEFAPRFAEVQAEMTMGPARLYINRISNAVKEGWIIFFNALHMNSRNVSIGR